MLNGRVANPIGDCRYHFSKKDGYDVWVETSRCSYVYILGDNPINKNVFYEEYGPVHNWQSKKTEDAITLYDDEKKQWLCEEGKVEW